MNGLIDRARRPPGTIPGTAHNGSIIGSPSSRMTTPRRGQDEPNQTAGPPPYLVRSRAIERREAQLATGDPAGWTFAVPHINHLGRTAIAGGYFPLEKPHAHH